MNTVLTYAFYCVAGLFMLAVMAVVVCRFTNKALALEMLPWVWVLCAIAWALRGTLGLFPK